MTRIGLIGTGNMGRALARGWSRDQSLRLAGYDNNSEQLREVARETGLEASESLRDLASWSDYLVLGVKPHHVQEVLQEIAPQLRESQCLLSIAAGVRLKALSQRSGGVCPVVRVMPNTPAMVGAGAFALCLDDDKLSHEQMQFLQGLFSSLGQVHVLREEYFDAFTALMGSGPAYVYHFMDSLIEAGVAVGFTRQQSREMVQALLEGAVEMAKQSGMSATELREMVTSPGGTTSAGVLELDRQGNRSAVADAVLAACRRSRELGE